MEKVNLVIYHAYCMDGMGSAWSAWKWFGDLNTEYMPCTHVSFVTNNIINKFEKLCKDRNVYIFDFSFPKELILKIKEVAKSFTLVDHHVSAMKELGDVEGCHFNMFKSGALLTWEYFFNGKPAPKMIQYISDRDLWKFDLPNSKEISAFTQTCAMTIENYDYLCGEIEDNFEECVKIGYAINHYIDMQAALTAEKAEDCEIIGKKAKIVCSRNFQSEIGHTILDTQDTDIAIIYFIRDGMVVFSLRTTEKEDASAIAKSFPGGGGHARAAGFKLKLGDQGISKNFREINDSISRYKE